MPTTFNTLTDVTKQQRLLFIYEDGGDISPIAYATTANLSFSADTIDVSNKMDGEWQTSMQGKKSAEVSIDALVAHKTGLVGETKLQAALRNGTSLRFIYAYYRIQFDETGMVASVSINKLMPMYSGLMSISNLQLTSDNGDVCKFSCTGANQGSVLEVYLYDSVEQVTMQTQSVTIPDSSVTYVVYDESKAKFLVYYNSKYYFAWTGGSTDRSHYYDAEDNIRKDVLFIEKDNEWLTYWDGSGLEIVS